jgi:deazaflavin-dependent oxidoreductase (nitroreductase family)
MLDTLAARRRPETLATPRRSTIAAAMPLPKRLARFNLVVTNRVLGPFARRLPGFAVVAHVGRRTGRTYRTPVNLFRNGDRYVIALTYGSDTQWIRNVLAAGAVEVETRGRRVQLVEPEIVHDTRRSLVPSPVAQILGLLDVSEFMVLQPRPRPSD